MKTANFPRLKLKQFPKIQERESAESKYWKSFNVLSEHYIESGAPHSIDFHPNPNDSSYIITGSVKVSLYDGLTDKLQRSYARFNDDAYSGKFRKDGKLIVAGDKTGAIKVYDVQTKALLRQFKHHTGAVRATRWTSNGLHVISGSDDQSICKFDLATEQLVWSNTTEHSDYIRTIDTNSTSSDIFVSGSYDHSICLWDSRQKDPILKMYYDHPIEYCLLTPSGTLLLTAGSNEVKVWDILNNGKCLHTFSNHQKNITCLSMENSNKFLSCGLDGHVKVYSLQTMQVLHGMKFGSPLVSVGISPNNNKLVIGFADGNVMIRNKNKEASANNNINNNSNALSMSRHHHGAGAAAINRDENHIETERQAKLQPYEKLLKNFNYQKALNNVLLTKNPIIIVTLLEELCRRNGLTIAISGRNEVSLEPLLSFIAKYINNPKYSKLLIQVMERILDLYAGTIGQSDMIDELFMKLQKQVKFEIGLQREIFTVLGSLDCIINTATLPKGHNEFLSNNDNNHNLIANVSSNIGSNTQLGMNVEDILVGL
eukprot:gene16565-22613_t